MAKQKAIALKPTHDYVVIRPCLAALQSKGGIVLPEQATKVPNKGEVLAIGPGLFVNGEPSAMCCEVGQVVYFTAYSGIEVEIDGEELKLLRDNEIIAIQE